MRYVFVSLRMWCHHHGHRHGITGSVYLPDSSSGQTFIKPLDFFFSFSSNLFLSLQNQELQRALTRSVKGSNIALGYNCHLRDFLLAWSFVSVSWSAKTESFCALHSWKRWVPRLKLHAWIDSVLDFYSQDRMLYYSCQSPPILTPLKYSFKQKLKFTSHRKYKPLITALYNKHKPLGVLMKFTGDIKFKILYTTKVKRWYKGYKRINNSK